MALEILLMTSMRWRQQTHVSTELGGLGGHRQRWEPSGGCGLCAGGTDLLPAWGCVSHRQPGGMKTDPTADAAKDLRLLDSTLACYLLYYLSWSPMLWEGNGLHGNFIEVTNF